MKRIVLLAVLAMCVGRLCADELVVSQYPTSYYSIANPIYGYYTDEYTRTQVLYRATQLNTLPEYTQIDSLRFYLEDIFNSWGNVNWRVSLFETESTNMSSSFITPSSSAVVYSGVLAVNTTNLTLTIPFSSGYVYNGGNLVLDIEQLERGSECTPFFCNQGYGSSTLSVRGHRSSPSGTWSYSATEAQPKTSFYHSIANVSCPYPEGLQLDSAVHDRAYLRWRSSGAGNYEVSYSDGQSTQRVYTTDTFCTLSSLASSVEYAVALRSICAPGDTSRATNLRFTSGCMPISQLPWRYDFTQKPTANPFAESCFDNERLSGTGTKLWQIVSSYNYTSYKTEKYLSLPYVGSSGVVVLRLPEMQFASAGGSELLITVRRGYVYNNPAVEGLRIMQDTAEVAFIPTGYSVASADVPAESAIGVYTYTFTLPLAGEHRISLVAESDDDSGFWIYDVEVRNHPTCYPPTAVTVDSLSYNMARIAWQPYGNEEGWQIEYWPEGDRSQAVMTQGPNPRLPLTGLQPDTEYRYEVVLHSIANGMLSADSLVSLLTFRTECQPIQVNGSYSYGFEDWGQDNSYNLVLPNCWQTSGTVRRLWDEYASTGDYAAGIRNTGSYMVMPLMQVQPNTQVRFMARTTAGRAMNLAVYCSRRAMLDSTAVCLGVTSVGSTYGEYIYPLPMSGLCHLIFESQTTSGDICVDDVTVEQSGGCNRPRLAEIADATQTSVTLSWTGNAPTYTVNYQSTDGSVSANNLQVNDTSVVIAGLQPSTNYTLNVTIVANCAPGVQSDTLQATLETATDCAPISSLPWTADFSTTPSFELPLCWDVPGAFSYSYVSVTNNWLRFWGGMDDGQTVYLPPFDSAVVLQNATMELYYWSEEDEEPSAFDFLGKQYGHFEVGAMANPANMFTYTALATLPQNRSNLLTGGNLYQVSLATVPANCHQLYIRYYGGENDANGYLLSVRVLPGNATPTALDNSEATLSAEKLLRNGMLYIRRGGHLYDATGRRVE